MNSNCGCTPVDGSDFPSSRSIGSRLHWSARMHACWHERGVAVSATLVRPVHACGVSLHRAACRVQSIDSLPALFWLTFLCFAWYNNQIEFLHCSIRLRLFLFKVSVYFCFCFVCVAWNLSLSHLQGEEPPTPSLSLVGSRLLTSDWRTHVLLRSVRESCLESKTRNIVSGYFLIILDIFIPLFGGFLVGSKGNACTFKMALCNF